MNTLSKINKEAEEEMKATYGEMEIGNGTEYAFKSGYFSGRLAVCIDENNRLKERIKQYEKEMAALLSTNTAKS